MFDYNLETPPVNIYNMITVTRVTVYDSADNHFTTKVSDKFPSYKEAVQFYKKELSSGEFEVKTVRMDYEEEDK